MSTQPQLYSVPFLGAVLVASLLSGVVVAGLLGEPQLAAGIAAFLSLLLWTFVLAKLLAANPATRAKGLQDNEVPAEPCAFHQDGAACCRSAGHDGLHLFKCASPACPGLTWPASALPHPRSCLATTEAAAAAKVRIEQPRVFSITITAVLRLDQQVIDQRSIFQETPYDYSSEDIARYIGYRLIQGIPLSQIEFFTTLPDALAEITDVVVENVTEDK